MKQFFFSFLFVIAATITSWAQAPNLVSYQAIARNNSGAVLANTNISVRVSIKNTSSSGPTVYQETFTGVTTNQFGLFTLQIGNGNPVTGTFTGINWGVGDKYIKLEFDPAGGTSYADMGTTQLLSVPYALYAAQSGGGSSSQTLNDLTDVNTAGVTNGQVLSWNGTSWVPVTVSAGTDAQTLSISGTSLTISNGNTVTLPAGGTYTAGNGIAISGGNVISNTGDNDNSTTNEIQTLSLSGNTLSISGTGGNSVTLPAGGTTYTAGSGISINGSNQISATDNSVTNEIQSLSLAGNTLSLSNGGGSVTLPSGGGGVSGSGTNSYIAKFTPNGTTLGNSLLQDDGTYIGINAAPNASDRLYLNAGASQTGGLKINYTNTANGSYALNGFGANGNSYLNYTGLVTFGTLTATNPIVYGASAAGTSPGILGATSGTNTSAAVIGLSNNWHGGFFASNDLQGGVGLFGYYTGAAESFGVLGQYAGSKGGTAISGQNISTSTISGYGVFGGYYGTADTSVGIVGFNNKSTTALNYGVEGLYNSDAYGAGVVGIGYLGDIPTANVDYGVWGSAGGITGATGTFAVYAQGNLTCTGLKNASVGTSKGNQLVYSIESPEVWFEDFGRGTLVNGQTTIYLDNLFLETVIIDADHQMIVTVTPEGNCKGLYVEPGTTSFNVKELNDGSSNVNFTYRITCKRKDYQDHRFGSDLTWGGGDTRINYHYVAPTPIDYNTAVNQYKLFKSQNKDNDKLRDRFKKINSNINSTTKN
jgi:hypothetical protein